MLTLATFLKRPSMYSGAKTNSRNSGRIMECYKRLPYQAEVRVTAKWLSHYITSTSGDTWFLI